MTAEHSQDGRIDPDASTYDVMSIYGTLVLEIQNFEMTTALLSLVAQLDPSTRSNASIRRQLDAAHRRTRHAFRRGSLAASRDRLRGKIDEALFSEIEELLPHRNRLAHRFLVERMTKDEEGVRFRPGTALEIIEYARRFKTIGEKLHMEVERRVDDFPDSPEDMDALLERFACAIMLDGDVFAAELRQATASSTETADTALD